VSALVEDEPRVTAGRGSSLSRVSATAALQALLGGDGVLREVHALP